jgi:protein-tyrosine phosphatase
MLVHCTQGKDRTGLLIAMILMLMDIPIDAITYDYRLSESELLSERESRLQEIREIGLTEDFATTPKDWVPKMQQHLQEKYGGIRKYLFHIGVDKETQDMLIDVLRS